MSDQTYNGWTNYETWNVKLWLDNEQGSQEYWQERTREILTDNCDKNAAEIELAGALESWHDELREECCKTPGTFGDLLTRALGRVNWREIAEAMLSAIED